MEYTLVEYTLVGYTLVEYVYDTLVEYRELLLLLSLIVLLILFAYICIGKQVRKSKSVNRMIGNEMSSSMFSVISGDFDIE